jgi:translation initiation factor 1
LYSAPTLLSGSEEEEQLPQDTLSPGQQKLRIKLDTKQRAGKAVTLVTGFTGKKKISKDLGKKLKKFLRNRRKCERQ